MKVKQLIKLLEGCDSRAEVQVEGCDCVNEAVGVDKIYFENTILIKVKNGVFRSGT